jgi:hypothetical protein
MIESFSDLLLLLQRSITWCYAVIIFLFLLFQFIKKERPGVLNILASVNFCLGLSSFYNIYSLITMLLDLRQAGFSNVSGPATRLIVFMSACILMLTCLELYFLFSRRGRSSWVFSFIALILVNWYIFYGWLSQAFPPGFISTLGVLPGKSAAEILLRISIFVALTSFCYLLLARMDQLPGRTRRLNGNTHA